MLSEVLKLTERVALVPVIHGSVDVALAIRRLMLGHRSPLLQTASSRIAERLNWRTFSFLLENSVFLLIGLQARTIIQSVRAGGVATDFVLLACVATLAAVILLRPLDGLADSKTLCAEERERLAGLLRHQAWIGVGVA